jgi:hypothetical protein
MPFELLTPTPATLKSVTPRTEHHGESIVVAISMRLQITGPTTLLDLLSPKLRHALYTAVEGQDQLPGVEPATPLLRFNAFESHALKGSFEGWTMNVDHGIDEGQPITLGGAKVDSFRVDAQEGGTVVLAFRVGSNDVDPEEIGLLCGKLGSEISITLHAPEKRPDAIDASSSAKDLPPDAGSLFADQHGPGSMAGDEDDDGPIFGDVETPVTLSDGADAVLIERSQPGTRTARGRDKTAKALADGAKETLQ